MIINEFSDGVINFLIFILEIISVPVFLSLLIYGLVKSVIYKKKNHILGIIGIMSFLIGIKYIRPATVIEWIDGEVVYNGYCELTIDYVHLCLLKKNNVAYISSSPFTYKSRKEVYWNIENNKLQVYLEKSDSPLTVRILDSHRVELRDTIKDNHDHIFLNTQSKLSEIIK